MPVSVSVEDGICTLTIRGSTALNTLSRALLVELDRALDDVGADPTIVVVILTGDGERAFSAGADISEMKDLTPEDARAIAHLGQAVFEKVQNLPQPTIAQVNGVALGGGCELSLACDMRIASSKARLGQPEVKLGIIPCWGGSRRLPQLVGRAKASEMMLSGEVIGAEDAVAAGLVNSVVAPDELRAEVVRLARAIARNSAPAVRRAKEALNTSAGVASEASHALEAGLFAECFGAEQQERMSAFLEKRPPRWGA